MTTYHRERSGKRSSYDDEENEEVMRAAGNNRDNGAKSDGTKTAADKWKGIGNRHMASQVKSNYHYFMLSCCHGSRESKFLL
jgi:hypothetical protein